MVEDGSHHEGDLDIPNYAVMYPEYAEAAAQEDPASYMYNLYYNAGQETDMQYFNDHSQGPQQQQHQHQHQHQHLPSGNYMPETEQPQQ